MFVRPSALNNSAHTGRIFMKFGFWVFFETIARKLKFYYNRTRITDTLLKTNINLWSYLAHFFLEWEMFRTKVVEEIKTHILSSTTFFLNHTVYETRCKNIVQPEGPQMTIWRMRIACRIAKATHTKPHTHTHSECIILIAFRRQQWLQERASALPYTYIASIVRFVTDT